MKGTGYLAVWNAEAVLRGQGVIRVKQTIPGEATLPGESFLYAEGGWSYGRSNLPPLNSIGGDYDYAVTRVQNLQPLYSEGEGDYYTPPAQEIGFGSLPALTASGLIVKVGVGSGNTSLPALNSIGGDYAYGVTGVQNLQPPYSLGLYGSKGSIGLISTVIAVDGVITVREKVVVLTSSGLVVDEFTGSKEKVAAFLEELLAEDQYSLLGEFSVEILSTAFASSSETYVKGQTGGFAVNGLSRVWVVNIETSASWQYEGFEYNDFFVEDGVPYGVASDGIYRLDGDNDAGRYIDAFIEFGRSNYGIPNTLKIEAVYVGVSSDKKMFLKVDADEQVYVYELRSNSSELKNHRGTPGKGLKGNFYNLTLLNQEGCDFVLATVHFNPIPTTRKI